MPKKKKGNIADEAPLSVDPLEFAKKITEQTQTIHDPSGKTSRRKQKTYSGFTKEGIEGYLQSPSANEKNLRDASIYMYQTNTRYRNLLNYYANIPSYAYTIAPVGFGKSKPKVANFKKQYLSICALLESFGLKKMGREVILTGIREGAFYGCIWGANGDSFILQKLNPDYCQIISKTDGGVFQFTYDMSQIRAVDLDTYYPPEFREMYDAYVADGNRYQKVPSSISVCFKADPTIEEYSIPIFAGVLPTLFQIKNIEELSESAAELSNYKLIAAKIPTDPSSGLPLVSYQTAMQYYSHISNNVGDRVGVAMTPFELKDYSFEQSGTTAQIDRVSRASENFFSAAGTTALLHGAPNSTSGVTKLSIKVDEALSMGFVYQFECIINKFLKTLGGTIKFKIHFLDLTCFNREDKIAELKGALAYGVGKLDYIAAVGVPQYDIEGKNYIEEDVLQLDKILVPIKTKSNEDVADAATTVDGEEKVNGRPEVSDSEISDEGEETRDNDRNDR